MASRIFTAGYASGLKQVVTSPNSLFLPGMVAKGWGVDKFITAVTPANKTVEYGEIVKITASGDYGVTVEGIVNADTTPQFAIVVRTQDGIVERDGGIPYAPLKSVPLTVWPIGLGSAPEKDQNAELVVVYTGSDAVGTDLTGTALYTTKLADDSTNTNGTATKTSASNLALGLEAVGKVFAPTNNATAKCVRVRIIGGKN